ncbi:hypothetical protein D5018_19000 [Parashewanella curva]|uniref:Uncharacterized protein n=1 Tax=Parashewanella curva TaxID=2338552 RepID=A0A3L8PRT0_9GAMM|nr:hypothetical protein [Parashewanella curva]RLV58110.1 hypothetical protein D5018_19000 [Parashewanella curva]
MSSEQRKQRRKYDLTKRKAVKKAQKLVNRHMSVFQKQGNLTSEQVGLPSLSTIISEYAYELCSPNDEEQMIDIICACWNVGSFTGELEKELWDIMIEPVLTHEYQDPKGLLRKHLKGIVAKRQSEYSDDPRFILSYQVNQNGSANQSLTVKSQTITPVEFLEFVAAKATSLV